MGCIPKKSNTFALGIENVELKTIGDMTIKEYTRIVDYNRIQAVAQSHVLYNWVHCRVCNIDNKAVLRPIKCECNGYTILDDYLNVGEDEEVTAVLGDENYIYTDAYEFECAINKMYGLSFEVIFESKNYDRKFSYTAKTFGDANTLMNELYDNHFIISMKIVQTIDRQNFKTIKVLRDYDFDED